ncbi:unnamed protein product [Prorocentrum cordatum]|uniref:Uncharacterized protein n=1 Tax=Prorocentrum cordatum TaxID=2364126 RepID=A0ABN9R9C3_9DINO|nr:unnamed protein product [Polarella glacialis]
MKHAAVRPISTLSMASRFAKPSTGTAGCEGASATAAVASTGSPPMCATPAVLWAPRSGSERRPFPGGAGARGARCAAQVVVFQDSVDGQQMFRQASHSCYVDMLICLLLQSRSLAECLLTWTGHHNVLL